ncbi:MAG: glutamine--fructose-6-phosphate transaminase (isomerizing) [Rhodothermales bacterium]
MCGIVGYIGQNKAHEVILNGLKRLEYRGYDSAGIAVQDNGLTIIKQKGKVGELEGLLEHKNLESKIGIGHTRWATHGFPNDVNAHPHSSADGGFALVHNGIVENYQALRARLQNRGFEFKTQTDTEALVHLIDDVKKTTGLPLDKAVRQALTQVVGTYGIAIVSADDDDLLIAARRGSPLILGVGDGEYFISSDASALVEYTRRVVYLNDGELIVVRRNGFDVRSIDDVKLQKEIHELEWDLEEIEKQGYPHFMLKEIIEQPASIANCMRGRLSTEMNSIKLGGLDDVMDDLKKAKRIIICACGTSWHAGLVGEYLIEDLARIPVEVEYASEFRYRKPILQEGDIVFAISQSGETADTLAAVNEAKRQGIPVFGVCNAVGSTIARETDAGVYLHAGPEIGVASTKAFTAQVVVLAMIAIKMAEGRTLTNAQVAVHLQELEQIPEKISKVLALNDDIRRMSEVFRYATNFLYLGRGYNFPVALEGALKLKEISYIHAEGYPAAEMKHGPIALIDRQMPVIFIALKDSTYEKIVTNIEEVVARHGVVIAITEEDNTELDDLCEYVIRIPSTAEFLSPLLSAIPLQLLAYHIAVLRGCDVDQPRNLAKSVTVE